MKNKSQESTSNDSDSELKLSSQEATPLRCFIASIISGAFAYLLYLLLNSIVQTYATKVITSNNPLVINLTTAIRTLVMGLVALATGIFGLVAVGVFLLGIQLIIQNWRQA